MKKINYLIGAAAILLTSCANDDLVRPVPPSTEGDGTAMSFAIKRANQSRATGLETVNKDFGVWAYKTKDNDGGVNASATETVMPNYLVGFHGEVDATSTADPQPNLGYTSAAKTEAVGSWFYAGLGKGDNATYVSGAGVASVAANKSANNNQYLKYWDDSYAKTYFYAYTPYKSGVTIAKDATGKKVTMNFPSDGTGWMYASAVADNKAHANVPLVFKSINSQINIAFYSTITGYDVEIIDYCSSKPGLGFVPSKQTVTDGIASYAAKSINTTGASKVVYTFDTTTGAISETVSQDSPGNSDEGFQWAVTGSTPLPTEFDFKGILPQNCGCGFTLNVSFKLTAKDTKEVVYVRGARVYVPETYFNWESNHKYTYKFKITDNVPGTTGSFTETAFSHEPNPLHALYPIVFEDVTIEDMTTTEVETIVNALTLDQTSVSVAAGDTVDVTAKVLGEITGGTLSVASSDETVATAYLSGNTVTITGGDAGTAVVTVSLTVGEAVYYANCAVAVTVAP